MKFQEAMNMLPNDWFSMDFINERYCFKPLCDPYSSEYMEIRSRLEGQYFYNITGIFKVQNPLLYLKYAHKRHEYSQRGDFETKQLFHDTAETNVHSICEWNFDWKLGQRFMFGPGVYFSILPDIAYKHSSRNNGVLRAMFVVDVLVQNVQFGDENVFLPDPGFDTVVAHGGKTYVKYFDCEYYPSYFATYEARASWF